MRPVRIGLHADLFAIALGYHRRFAAGDELFADYGTPAAFSTLRRFTVKYVVRTGGIGAGS